MLNAAARVPAQRDSCLAPPTPSRVRSPARPGYPAHPGPHGSARDGRPPALPPFAFPIAVERKRLLPASQALRATGSSAKCFPRSSRRAMTGAPWDDPHQSRPRSPLKTFPARRAAAHSTTRAHFPMPGAFGLIHKAAPHHAAATVPFPLRCGPAQPDCWPPRPSPEKRTAPPSFADRRW